MLAALAAIGLHGLGGVADAPRQRQHYAFRFAPPAGGVWRYHLDVRLSDGDSNDRGTAEFTLRLLSKRQDAYEFKTTLESFRRAGQANSFNTQESATELIHPDGRLGPVEHIAPKERSSNSIPDARQQLPILSGRLEKDRLIGLLFLVQVGGLNVGLGGHAPTTTFVSEGGLANLMSDLNPRRAMVVGDSWVSNGGKPTIRVRFFGVKTVNHVRLAKLRLDTGMDPSVVGTGFATIEIDTGLLHTITIPRAGNPAIFITLSLQ